VGCLKQVMFLPFLFVAKLFLLQKKTVFYSGGTPFFQTVLALDKVWVFVFSAVKRTDFQVILGLARGTSPTLF